MKEIQGVDLAGLVQESAEQLLQERRKAAGGQIKSLLVHAERLRSEKISKHKELKRLEDKLTSVQVKIDKLKAGDWSVLQEESKGQKTKQEPNEYKSYQG